MRIIHLTLIGLITVAGSIAAQAQQAAANPQPAAASSPMDCTKAAKCHDHAKEKGSGSSLPNPCTKATAASGPTTKPHDHAKVHKQG
jgi:ABC-type phosphate transport system substrate-binding protein